jgi:hypothetical protein
MNPLQRITCKGIEPALAMLPKKMDSAEARVAMLAICLQESQLTHRRQMGDGPARSFWQMERGGGVRGVLTHTASRPYAEQLCAIRGVVPSTFEVWEAIEFDDVLAAGFARLLLWTDAFPLPAVTDSKRAWEYYLRTWNPGKPHPETWAANHSRARLHVAEDAL